ncbi:MAG: polysaccharide deacetylase family protein [Devosia sp.]
MAQASKRLADRLIGGASRVAARRIPFRPHFINLDAPLVSFSFDDFPLSAAENAAPILEAAGARGTYYFAGGLAGKLENGREIASKEVAADLAARGHDIGGHTHSHYNVQVTPRETMLADVSRNIADIRTIVDRPPASFAYPYGVVSLPSKLALANRFRGLRGIETGINARLADLAHLRAQELYDASSTIEEIATLLDDVARQRGWLIFYTHDVEPNPTSIGCSTEYFRAVVQLVASRGIEIVTVANGLERIGVAATADA